MSAKVERRKSLDSANLANHNLPEDPKSKPQKYRLSPETKERYARNSLAYGNFLGRSAGMVTAVPKKLGRTCGHVAGMMGGEVAGDLYSAFSTRPAEVRRKKKADISATVEENTRVLGGLVGGGPPLLVGGVLNVAFGGLVAGKLGAKYLDKHELERPAYSWRLNDDLQHEPGSEKLREPRLPIFNSRHHNERIGFGKYVRVRNRRYSSW